MKLPCHAFVRFAVGAVALAVVSVGVRDRGAWSEPAIRVVVPYPPGGGADVVTRVMADAIGDMQGPTMIVENRPGAATMIGTRDVVRARPDGNTLLATNNALAIVPHLRKLDYDPLSSLEPICIMATTPTVVMVSSASPYRTLDDLLGSARARPGALTFGATPGAKSHVDFEMILHPAGARMTLVPFSGTPPIVNAILGGQVDAAFVDYPAAAGLFQAGRLRALAVGSRARIEWLPDVPTISEVGLGDFDMEVWYGLLAPAQAPQPMISQLAAWITRAAKLPQTQARLAAQGMQAVDMCGAPFTAHLRKQYDDYGRVISEADIKAE